jgi:hypothetical protein
LTDAGRSLGKSGPIRLRTIPADAWALGLLVVLTGLATWHLAYYDVWLTQQDIINFFIPWYGYLGHRLSEGAIPGWIPYAGGGAPFAGDPQSGWMYFPAMALFPFFSLVVAFKLLIGLQFLICGVTMHLFARVMGLGVAASLVAAIVFEFNPFANNPAYCCTNRLQIWTWIPMLLLGVELGLRAGRWRDRLMPCCLAALALSQMYAGWPGQGLMYALLVFASFLAYRCLFSAAPGFRTWRDRLVIGAAVGFGSTILSLGIAAAGLLPRLAVSSETMIGLGNYEKLPGSLIPSPGFDYLLLNIVGSNNAPRAVSVGGVALVLALLAPWMARRGFATVYFGALTIVAYLLMLKWSPLFWLVDLIPRFGAIHSHNTINVSAIGATGPAMLAGAAVQALPRFRPRGWSRWFVLSPIVAIVAILGLMGPHGLRDAAVLQIAAGLTTIVLLFSIFGRTSLGRWAPAALVALAFIAPTGAEIVSARIGHPIPSPWRIMARFDPVQLATIDRMTNPAPSGDAAAFLQARSATEGPFRVAGYTTIDPPPAQNAGSYVARRNNPYVQAILSNGRAITLELNDVSAYNPSQNQRYATFINAINGRVQNYHVTFVYPRAIGNKLFSLLNVRYLLVDNRMNASTPGFAELTAGRHPVFQDAWVTIYESNAPTSSVWIVHQVKRAKRNRVLGLMEKATFDPRTMAIAEGGPFAIKSLPAGAVDQAAVTSYEPERIRIAATAGSAGLLVISETFESGWRAYVDGKPVPIRLVDYAFRGVALSAGSHIVELRYEPRGLHYGLWISIATIAACLALGVWRSVLWFRRSSSESMNGAHP